jgi:DNA-binding XRE family transcriptional regulator
MDHEEFRYFRQKLQKSQREMAQLLGTSRKAIESYEQGWRNIPAHAERQVLVYQRHNLSRKTADELEAKNDFMQEMQGVHFFHEPFETSCGTQKNRC